MSCGRTSVPHVSAKFLFAASRYSQRGRRERSIFELGARGYFENPTSDLLAFFLRPGEEHGFASAFLGAYFDVLGRPVPDLSSIQVEREHRTATGKRIDLVIVGADWVLVIENKIRHGQNNPFREYEGFIAERYTNRRRFFTILSPRGSDVPGWEGVTYKQYIDAIRDRMRRLILPPALSRWQILAHELLLNLKNQATESEMDTESASFVEQHLTELQQARELHEQFKDHSVRKIAAAMATAFPAFEINVTDAHWLGHSLSIRCTSHQWTGADMILYWSEVERRFLACLYLPRSDDRRLRNLESQLGQADMQENTYPFWTEKGADETLDGGIKRLVDLAMKLAAV